MAVDDILAMRAPDPSGLSRMMRWSFGVHLGVIVVAIVVPRSWIATDRTPPEMMTINLGAGTPGPRSTGRTPTAGRTVEEVAPPPTRPEPIPPSTARPDPPATAEVPPTQPPPDPPDVPKPTAPLRTPPATGEQIQTGSSPVETGARGDSPGLSFGGGGGQAMVDPVTCYCEEYLNDMIGAIQGIWKSHIPGRGDTIMQYTIQRDGTITDIQTYRSGGAISLDLEARRALQTVRLGPLPVLYPDETIVIRLTFPYGRQ